MTAPTLLRPRSPIEPEYRTAARTGLPKARAALAATLRPGRLPVDLAGIPAHQRRQEALTRTVTRARSTDR